MALYNPKRKTATGEEQVQFPQSAIEGLVEALAEIVPIELGGTGAATKEEAISNLIYFPAESLPTLEEDTVANWGKLGFGYTFLNDKTITLNQPAVWGFLINIPNPAKNHVYQLLARVGGTASKLYHRQGWVGAASGEGGWIASWEALNATADVATKLATARTIGLSGPFSSTPQAFDGTKNITIPVSALKEAYLEWGGKSIEGDISPVDMAASSRHNANRLALANPAGIIIEYSNDGGATWLDYGATDVEKVNLVSASGATPAFTVGKRTRSMASAHYVVPTTDDLLRITLLPRVMKVYTQARKLLLQISTDGALDCKVHLETATIGDPENFNKDLGTHTIKGWSGWNSIPLTLTFGGSETQTTQCGALRLTFSAGEIPDTNYPRTLTLMDLVMLGPNAWTFPSTLAKTNHLYQYDANGNVVFPAKVTATSFKGTLEGAASEATKAYKDGNDNNIVETYQTKTDDALETTSKNIPAAINENKKAIDKLASYHDYLDKYFVFTLHDDSYYSIRGRIISEEEWEAGIILDDWPETLIIPAWYRGKPVTAIEDYAFYTLDYFHERVKTIIIEDGITTIGAWSFAAYDSDPMNVHFTSSVKEIKLPSTITSISQGGFAYCLGLEKINLEDTKITILPSWCLSEGYHLKELKLPSTLQQIKTEAIATGYDSPIERVFIPKSVLNIEGAPFPRCPNLTIYYEGAAALDSWDEYWNKCVSDPSSPDNWVITKELPVIYNAVNNCFDATSLLQNNYQTKIDNALETTDKSVPGAINEVYSHTEQLIAGSRNVYSAVFDNNTLCYNVQIPSIISYTPGTTLNIRPTTAVPETAWKNTIKLQINDLGAIPITRKVLGKSNGHVSTYSGEVLRANSIVTVMLGATNAQGWILVEHPVVDLTFTNNLVNALPTEFGGVPAASAIADNYVLTTSGGVPVWSDPQAVPPVYAEDDLPIIRFTSAKSNNGNMYFRECSETDSLGIEPDELYINCGVSNIQKLRAGDTIQLCCSKLSTRNKCRYNESGEREFVARFRKYKLRCFATYTITEEDLQQNSDIFTITLSSNKYKIAYYVLHTANCLGNRSDWVLRLKRTTENAVYFSNSVRLTKTRNKNTDYIPAEGIYEFNEYSYQYTQIKITQ